MKSSVIYQHLKETAEKLDITVSEQNLGATGVNAKSGLCRVKGKAVFIMDKNLPVRKKAEILADCLRNMPLEDIFVMPAVRRFLEKR